MNQETHASSAQDGAGVTTDADITGMTCVHCEVMVERLITAMPGVRSASVNERSGRAKIISERPLDWVAVDTALAAEGYGIRPSSRKADPGKRNYASAAAALAIVAGLLLAARHFDLLPTGLTVSDNMTLGFVFAIGLAASVSSCMAVTGGLLVALAAKYNEATAGQSPSQRFVPHLYFNAARLVSYAVFGGVIGAAGSALALSPAVTGILTIAVSAVMILTGLQMLGLMPRLGKVFSVIPKSAVHRIHDLVTTESRKGAMALGAATFFLPCGFTLALQLYVLSKGSASLGAATMFVFALGTLPALLSLSVLSSFASGKIQSAFLRLAGAAVIVLGLMNIQYGLVQSGNGYGGASSIPAIPQQASAQSSTAPVQIAEMKIEGFDYIPNRFTVKAGVPVEWRIDARHAEGCGRVLIMRGAGIVRLLSSEETTIISFTPKAAGKLAFNCSMGMMTPGSGFIVTN
jgi:sulfite exporter TauE/SafE/copper chaperone CopZ